VIRTLELAEYGLKILRFAEQEMKSDMFNVLRTLEIYIETFDISK